MSKVTISLNGRAFTIGCEEGQQAYLRELAAHLDAHVRDLAEKVGQIGELRSGPSSCVCTGTSTSP